ncbi:MAG: hypothetical protein JKY26_07700 [Pseudomonas sp.]|nr:hypothetical protein [Pseudomonas sp.]
MKNTLLACALVITTGLSSTAFAGSHASHETMHERHMERMTQELNLTEQQQERISTLNTQYAERYREMRRAHREEVRALLDKEQQAKMDTLREERREKMAKRHAENKRGDRAHGDH